MDAIQQGRILTLAAIAGVVLLLLLMSVFGQPSPSVWPVKVLILAVCVHLYYGSNWARWVIAISLLLPGLIWTYQLITSRTASVTWRPVAFAVLTGLFLVLGVTLIVSKSTVRFLDNQRNRQRTLTRRMLRMFWIIVLVGYAVWIYNEGTPTRFEFFTSWELPSIVGPNGEEIGLLFITAPRQHAVYDLVNAPVSDLSRRDYEVVAREEWKVREGEPRNKGVAKVFRISGQEKLRISASIDLRHVTVAVFGLVSSESAFAEIVNILKSMSYREPRP